MSNTNQANFEQCTLEDVRDALCYLSSDERDFWVQMAFAVKSEFGESGFEVWDAWSRGSDKYKQKDARAVWRSAKTYGGSGTVTIATLFKAAIDKGYQHREISAEEKSRFKQEQAERAARRKAEEKLEQARIAKMHQAAAEGANKLLAYTGAVGTSKYLGAKHVGAHGIRFFKQPVLIVTDEETATVSIYDDSEYIRQFLKDVDVDVVSFKHLRRGVIAIPMLSEFGQVVNLQLIFSSGKKSFLKGGQKKGCYHHIGETVDSVLLVAEGYATAASLYEATGYPVAVAFDAGNLLPVVQHLKLRMPEARFVIAGDDDHETDGNPGKTKAEAAAIAVGGIAVLPKFAARAAA